MPWGDMSWGSVQYDVAHDFFASVIEGGGTKYLASIGVVVSFERIRSFEEAKELFVQEFVRDDDVDRDEEMKGWDAESLAAANAATNVEAMFATCRDSSWDLWSAAPFIASCFFEDLKVEDVPIPEDVRGPIMNQMVQQMNNETGLMCALLVVNGLVKDEDCFGGFDT